MVARAYIVIALSALLCVLVGCYNMQLTRKDNNTIEVKTSKPYSLLLLPDGTALVDTQGLNEGYLDWFGRVLGATVDRAADSIQWRLGDAGNDDTTVVIRE